MADGAKKIVLAADHAGFSLKEKLREYLLQEGFEIEDCGAFVYDEKDDYPDFIIPAAQKAVLLKCPGIVIGGSGQGEAIAANKVKGARAALYYSKNPDIIRFSKTHNDANILSLGARFLSVKDAQDAVKLWLSTKFPKEPRHVRRIGKISRFEKDQ